jgi:hypothetical protein
MTAAPFNPSPVSSSAAPHERAHATPRGAEKGCSSAQCQRALERALARWELRFGTASRAELEANAAAGLAELEERSLGVIAAHVIAAEAERLCAQVERAHEARFGRRALDAELTDERARDRARSSAAELVRYQEAWERRLARLQRAHPQRWHVPGLSDDEARDALTLHLIELIVAPPGGEPPPGRSGQCWGLCMARVQLSVLRRSFRLAATPIDFEASPARDRAENQEERWLELESEQRRALALDRAERQLNQPQRRWLAAMQHAAAEGHFFQSSDDLNLSAASRALGKNRSSALRAYRSLEECFRRELERLE